MHTVIERYPHAGFTIEILDDPEPVNPRKDYDNVGTMACWHDRHTLGDEEPDESPSEYLKNLLMKHSGLIALPLYLYDHSGITMSTGGFSDSWDSGQVGFIYVTPERAKDEWGSGFVQYIGESTANFTKDAYYPSLAELNGGHHKLRGADGSVFVVNAASLREVPDEEVWRARLKGEVEDYDNYLRGECHGFRILDPHSGEELDSCWGFLGDIKWAKEAAESITDCYAKEALSEGERRQVAEAIIKVLLFEEREDAAKHLYNGFAGYARMSDDDLLREGRRYGVIDPKEV